MNKSLNITPVNVNDYRRLAEQRLPRQLFDYIDGGSYQETTLASNISAFNEIYLRQRILRDVANIDTSTTLFGEELAMPVILAPVGLAGCYARRGEVQALKAAKQHNIPFCLSTVSICSIEELQRTNNDFWLQLYVIKDRSYAIKLLQRAKNAGSKTLVLTADLPVLGERYRDIRNGLSSNKSWYGTFKRGLDVMSHPRWLWDVAIKGQPLVFGNLTDAVPNANSLDDFKAWVDSQFDPSMTWQDIAWLRDHWQGNLVIKGIMDSDDAKQAVAVGADAIVVSNHGGRQLDGVPASIKVLPEIAQTVNKQCKVLFDGGIRSGVDVVKALALGADACLLGRAWAYALAAEGEQGVSNILVAIHNEIRVTMALIGVIKTVNINKNVLY